MSKPAPVLALDPMTLARHHPLNRKPGETVVMRTFWAVAKADNGFVFVNTVSYLRRDAWAKYIDEHATTVKWQAWAERARKSGELQVVKLWVSYKTRPYRRARRS